MKQYKNFMEGLLDSAIASDYWPVSLLPMPYVQAAMWNALDNRPVLMKHVTDRTIEPPPNYNEHTVLPSRGEDQLTKQAHVEEYKTYGPGEGQQGTTVWYRCGYGTPMWMVLEAVERN